MGHDAKDILTLEKALRNLAARVEVIERQLSEAWQPATSPRQAAPARGPLAKIPDGEEDCD